MKTGTRSLPIPGQPLEVIPFFCNQLPVNQLPWPGLAHRDILAFASRADRQ